MAADALTPKPLTINLNVDPKVKVAPSEEFPILLRESSTVSKSQAMGAGTKSDRERKIGHRRVDEAGQVTYKKTTTSELMATIQLGIQHSIGKLSPKAKRDVLYEDFHIVETIFFPREGSNLTPAHRYSDFRFKTYAPIAFRYFRDLFGIQPDDFLLSLCNEPLRELSNPGASGSIFYITQDDEFIIKTVQHKEAEFLQKLLPGYYMNLNQNPRTLLPKFYGLYCYQCGGKNIRFVIMNNLLPSSIVMHSKYDLKGSTHKRKAAKHELTKKSPTYKDLDFLEHHPEGILLEVDTYSALLKTVERDCRVLQSFKIMDYSMLLGIHNLDQSARDRAQEPSTSQSVDISVASSFPALNRARSVRHRLAQYSTAMESIHATSEPLDVDSDDVPSGGIPARSIRGERLLLYIGVIDTLQSYRFAKKLEHTFKSMVADGDSISVHRPGFYAQRFQTFFANSVFKKIPSSLRHTPSKRKSVVDRQKSLNEMESTLLDKSNMETEQGAVGGRPDVLLSSLTPLPPYTSHSPKPPTAPKPKPSVDKKPAVFKKQIKFSQSSDTSDTSTLPLEGTSSSFGANSAADSEEQASPLLGMGKSPNKHALHAVNLGRLNLRVDVSASSSASYVGTTQSATSKNVSEESFLPESSVSDVRVYIKDKPLPPTPVRLNDKSRHFKKT